MHIENNRNNKFLTVYRERARERGSLNLISHILNRFFSIEIVIVIINDYVRRRFYILFLKGQCHESNKPRCVYVASN
jgi:hypothetical protein